MSEQSVKLQERFQPVKLQEPFQPVRKRNRSWVGAIVLVLFVVVMLVGAYAVTLGPEHYAQTQAVRVSGGETLSIGDPAVATVVPAAEWSTRPLVTPLFGELQLFKNPAVIFGVASGVQLESPDGMLTVTFEPVGEVDPAALFAADGQPGAPIQQELLSTGVSVRHIDTGESKGAAAHGLVAVIGPAEQSDAAASASTSASAAASASGSVLVRVTLDDNAKFNLSDYLPALSELFETVELAGRFG